MSSDSFGDDVFIVKKNMRAGWYARAKADNYNITRSNDDKMPTMTHFDK